MFSSVGKTLLKNVIRHTDHHNRRVEESDMWRVRNLQATTSNDHDDRDRLMDQRRPYDDQAYNSSSMNRRAHMDYVDVDSVSTHWTRELYKAEEQDPGRWGHGGYKELYPDDFNSDRSDDERRKRHLKRKKRKKEKKSKKRRKRETDIQDCSEKKCKHSESSDSDIEQGHKQHGEREKMSHRHRRKYRTKKEHEAGKTHRHRHLKQSSSKHKRVKTDKEEELRRSGNNHPEKSDNDLKETSKSASSEDEIYKHKRHKRRGH